MAHVAMQTLIVELLGIDGGRWRVTAFKAIAELGVNAVWPDLMVIDTADFAAVLRQIPASFVPAGVVVIGPEPEPAYRRAALS